MSLTEQQQTKLDKIQLDASWKHGLSDFLLSTKMDALKQFLVTEIKANKVIYPPNALIFNAFNTTPLAECKNGNTRTRPISWAESSTWAQFLCKRGLLYHHLYVIFSMS
jgi:hypothetical protein